MAGLFKNKIIKAKLETYIIPDFEQKLATVKGWLTAYQNKSLQQKTESQCEQAFNQAFFVDILGYKAFPSEIYTIDPKSHTEATGQKPDATLGWFTNTTKKVFGVVEIKDSKTPLDKSQHREGNLSPIQQAFKYKPQYKDCSFVIATNFFEIRLFKDNQLDYEIFTLETLADPKEEYFNFKKFYLLLCAENFIAEKGQSKTEKLLSEIRIEQEQITEKFYKEYKTLRLELINNILKNNATDKPLAVEKAQKIVDRIVFTCFCEDLDLLPQGKLQEVIHHTEKMGLAIPIWMILKGYFQAIDSGSAKLEIPNGYNGELFKPDPELENLKIDDEICLKFINLAHYDFSDDLSVNILGHIFEQSITDLEELKQEDQQEKQVSKRKKDGIFYTPDYIVDYIVKNSLGKYLQEHEENILKKHGVKTEINDATYQKRLKTAYEEYQVVLRNVKILDPACGSGAFLVKVYDYLLAENKRIVSILTDLSGGKADLFNTENYIKFLLQNNIYGVDLNPESVEITKLSLWLKTAHKGEKLVNLKNNIKCGNSLIDDPGVAGERAFNWEIEFEDIMKKGGFDIIVGNPPYVRQETIKDFSKYLSETYRSFSGKADLYVYFYEKGTFLLKKGGFIGYISSSKFFEANYGKNLLAYLTESLTIEEIINFGDLDVFQGISAYPVIFIGKKKQEEDYEFKYYKIDKLDFSDLTQKIYQLVQEIISIKDFRKNEYKFFSKKTAKLLEKIREKNKSLKNYCGSPIVGIKTGFNDGFITNNTNKSEFVKDYIFGKDVKKYCELAPENKIIFPYKFEENSYKLIELDQLTEERDHLMKNKNELEKRAIIKEGLINGSKKWFEYQQINLKLSFDEEYIIYPNVSLGNNFTLSRGNIIDMTAFIIKSNDRYLLTILNSKITDFFMRLHAISRRGGYLEYKVQYLEKLPIPSVPEEKQESLKIKADLMLSLHRKFQEKLQKALQLIKHEFQLKKINNKLEKFYELDFDSFIKALEIKGIDLQKKGELLDFFEKNKQELLNLNSQIKKEDDIIDNMVFDLYDLTSEEMAMVVEI